MRRTFLVVLFAAFGTFMTPVAWSAEPAELSSAKSSASKHKSRKKSSSKLVVYGGSGETATERSTRLRRECKGRPNAGACTGYTD